jgi:hypothetical protein
MVNMIVKMQVGISKYSQIFDDVSPYNVRLI